MYAPGSRGALVGRLAPVVGTRCIGDVGGGMAAAVSLDDFRIVDELTAREEAGSALSSILENTDVSGNVAASYNNMGLAYKEKGECDQALECYQKALTSWLKRLGPDHPNVAMCYNNIGEVHRGKGEHDKALELMQKSLVILLKVFSQDHPHVASIYNNACSCHK